MAGAYTAYVLQRRDRRRRRLAAGRAAGRRSWSPALLGRAPGVPADPADVRTGRWTRCWSPGASSLILQQLARDIFGAPNVQTSRAGLAHRQRPIARRPDARRPPAVHPGPGACSRWSALTAGAAADPAGPADPGGGAEPRPRRGRPASPPRGSTGSPSSSAPGLAGVAGVALTLLGPIGPTLGTNYIVDAFLVVVVGGIGQLKGAVIAAFALGLLQSIVEYIDHARAWPRCWCSSRSWPSCSCGRRACSAAHQEPGMTRAGVTTMPAPAGGTARCSVGLAVVASALLLFARAGRAVRLPAEPARQVPLLRDGRGRHRPGLGPRRHADPRPGRVLRPRRLRHGDAPEAGRRRPGPAARLHGARRQARRAAGLVGAVRQPGGSRCSPSCCCRCWSRSCSAR